MTDETHLRQRLCVWPKGGTVIIHPALTAATAASADAFAKVRYPVTGLSTAPSGTNPVVR
jgi:hypothetical protein